MVHSLQEEEIERLHRRAMKDRRLPQRAREGLQALWASHSTKGQEYRRQGRPREAIEEFRKDTEIDILGDSEAMVAEKAFCLMGDTFMELEETESAIDAYEGALKLWRQYGYGSAPHVSLAEAYLEQGRIDDAIGICEEELDTPGSWAVRQVWEKAKQQKSEGER